MVYTSSSDKVKATCISCNIERIHDEFIQKGLDSGFKAIVCPSCGLKSIHPLPVNVSSGESYKETKGVAKTTDNDLISRLRKIWRIARLRPVMEMLIKNLSAGRILEIGAGDGTLIELVKEKDFRNNYHVSALELSSSDYLSLRKKGFDVQQCTVEQAAFPENSFDAVLATHVFEHIPNVVEVFDEIRKILKPGGFLIASVPSESALTMKLGMRKMWRDLGIRGHIYSYNKSNFSQLFVNCDFNVLEAKETIIPQAVVVGINRKSFNNEVF